MLLFILELFISFWIVPGFQYISCYSLSVLLCSESVIYSAFQYISCYSLSQWVIFRQLLQCCFNTSHVTLYPEENYSKALEYLFQYISCYSLSANTESAKLTTWKFQYISCYSLSGSQASHQGFLFMFQYISCYSLSVWHTDWQDKRHVSIHLMLLFIK